jgi:hypothetical protein
MNRASDPQTPHLNEPLAEAPTIQTANQILETTF